MGVFSRGILNQVAIILRQARCKNNHSQETTKEKWGIQLFTVAPFAKDELARKYSMMRVLYCADWLARRTPASRFWAWGWPQAYERV